MPVDRRPPSASEAPSWWALVTTLATGTAIALLLAVGMATMSEGGETRPRAEVGDVLDHPFADEDEGETATVLLPWQRVDVSVGPVRTELPEIAGGPADVAAPEGGRFVRVDVRPMTDVQPSYFATAIPRRSSAELVLTADGRDHPLDSAAGLTLDPGDAASLRGGTRWVAVEGHPSDLELRVITDGQEQSVRPDGSVTHGRAADLEDVPTVDELRPAEQQDCGPAERVDETDLRVEGVGCSVTLAARTPFVDGPGWAESGHDYLVVHIARDQYFDIDGPDEGRGLTARDPRLDARLGTTRPVSGPVDVNEINRGTLAITSVDDPQQFVFEIPSGEPPGDLTVSLDIETRPRDPFATEDAEEVRLEWTVPAGDLA